MTAAQMSVTVKRAWKMCNKHRAAVGLPSNVRPPRKYKVTLWLSAAEYIDAVNLAKMRGESLTKHGRLAITGAPGAAGRRDIRRAA